MRKDTKYGIFIEQAFCFKISPFSAEKADFFMQNIPDFALAFSIGHRYNGKHQVVKSGFISLFVDETPY